MKFIKNIFLMFISLFLVGFLLDVSASNSFSSLETQIHQGSNISKIKKIQLLFRDLNLYSGEIDGNYESIKPSLVNYQKKAGINKDIGYFGVKTLTALRKDFPEKFDELTNKHLRMDKPSTNVRYFFLTAYYSPLPGQKRYTTGSYEGDKRLNGEGKITASGKGVFEGLLAGPRNYKFGTKIEFEGLGVGVVEDRGGAIVNSGERGHEYDRIDVWMGYGDEGLERALKWGKRKVKGKVVPNTRELTIEFDDSIVTKYRGLKVDAENPKKENVKKLQSLFNELKLYTGSIDGNYDSIKNTLIKYQVENNIISSKNHEHAGYFGNKTYIALREEFGGNVFKNKKNKLDEDVALSDEERVKLDKIHKKIVKIINKKYIANTIKNRQYRKKIRTTIDLQLIKIKDEKRKRYLKYIKSVL